MRFPYHIIAPGYSKNSAGIRVLHKLNRLLREAGFDSRLSCDEENSDRDEAVCVYPEIVPGNPLGFRKVARWDLCYPVHRYAESERVFYYLEEFHTPASQATHRLRIFDIEDFFCPPAAETSRQTDYFFQGKGDVRQQVNTDGMVEITMGWPASREELARVFQGCRRFYTCGHTALAREAFYCGAEVVFCDDLVRQPLQDRETAQREQEDDLRVFIKETQKEWPAVESVIAPMNPGWETWVR